MSRANLVCIRVEHPECAARQGVWDNLSQFKPGRSYCRKCFSYLIVQWRKANPDKIAASRERERSVRVRRAALRAEERKENIILVMSPEEREYRRQIYARNRSTILRRIENRKRGLAVSCEYTEKEWVELLGRYNNNCLACGTDKNITKDHIIPIKKGGRDILSNLQPLCTSCNSTKGTKIVDYRPS